jgi:hypothetical protein
MRYKSLFLFLIVFVPVFAFAQNTGQVDVVTLKNGSVLRGEILEMNSSDFVRIMIFDRNIISIPAEEISEIGREQASGGKHFKSSGYLNRTGFELLPGPDSTTPRFYMVNGYQFSERIGVGIGTGFTPYNDPLSMIPLFIDMNFRLLKENYSPVFFAKFGYNFSIHNDDNMEMNSHTGGLLFNAGIGLQFNLSSGFGWYLNAGYNIDNSRFEFDTWGPQTVREDLSYRRINFGIGLAF